MTTDVYFEDASKSEEWDRNMKKMCKCGHTLLMHGSTMQYDEYTKQTYLRTSICCVCECNGFESA